MKKVVRFIIKFVNKATADSVPAMRHRLLSL